MDKKPLRHALYYRLRWLRQVLARPWVRRLLRGLAWASVLGYFAFAALILTLRYAILPSIGQYQGDIEAAATRAVGQKVRIGHLGASWDGLNPHLTLTEVAVTDSQGRQSFAFSQVDTVLSWDTLWRFKPILSLLEVRGPILNIRRDTAGKIRIAGIDAEGETDPAIADWILAQKRIRIRDAMVVWEDAFRGAPPLILEDLQFGLDNRGRRHSFGFSAAPPSELADRLDIRGEFKGDLPLDGNQIMARLNDLTGKLYVELNYADLAGWKPWLDYPLDLPSGRGALRFWGDWDEGEWQATADLALENIRVRLAESLPELALNGMRGRVTGRYRDGQWLVEGRRVELSSAEGIRLTPTDIHADWRWDEKAQRLAGSANANLVDLDALNRLAAYLPLSEGARDLLQRHAPQGRIADLRATWEAEAGRLKRYGLQARFDGLGLLADGGIPGVEGLSGQVEASEKGGSLLLDAKKAVLDLPTVFPESKVGFDELRAKAGWKLNDGQAEVKLERLDFASPDAAGSARGTYVYTGDGPGRIDLTANLSRADGTAVWRYMPKVVNDDTRNWLKRGIVQGKASDAKLTLKGDLRDFPFRDKRKGEFLITAKAQGVKVDFAPGWPAIDGVEADMRFGVGMRVDAKRGRILGTEVGPVVVQIPDFDSGEEMLLVRGDVTGPTSEFLRFIDQSPVAAKIDNFTEDIRAVGNGKLDLKLEMPLRHVLDTKVAGDYQFTNNQVNVVPGLPPLTQVNGRLQFTENGVTARDITAHVLGGPMKLSVKNDKDLVNVLLSGTANMREARKTFDSPFFDYLAGSTSWKGEVRVRKKTAEFVIDSTLAGISSSLPEPFNKTATSTLPLHFEKVTTPETAKEGGDQIRVTLGKVVDARLLRRKVGDDLQVARGVVAVGEAVPKLPDRGVVALINVPRFDGDLWRRLLAGGSGNGAGNGNGAGAASSGPSPIGRVTLKSPVFRFFQRDLHDAEVSAMPRDSGWQLNLSAKEVAGSAYWSSSGKGALQADLKYLYLPPADAKEAEGPAQAINELPGLDIKVADFNVGERRLGKLDLKAHNEGGVWQLDNVAMDNPDGKLRGKGSWSSVGGHQTRLDFELNALNIGKLLERMGYAGAVRGGTATLKGDLKWAGPLTSVHYPSLSGNLNVKASKGQFAKLEPGIGKLLGLLSLQSIPRRLTLDFRDIFSEGFAFDSIEGKTVVKGGVMQIVDELHIYGPAAKVVIKGQTDLARETQDLNVSVQPELGGVAAVGAVALAHPVVGAATYLVNKILQSPLDKMFAFQYRVTGTWSDPQVDKTGQTPVAADKATDKATDKASDKANDKKTESPQ